MTELATGILLGLGAGISPGPLLTLVITSSLERGFEAGLRVALAPLITDLPIVVLSVGVAFSVGEAVLRGLGIAGGVLVAAMGISTLSGALRPGAATTTGVTDRRDLWRGVAVNLLSPHPWIFWISAGAPLLVTAWRRSPMIGGLFLAAFYGLLVGSKIVIAWVVGRGGARLDERWRRRVLAGGGVALVVGGAALLWQALAGRL